jgi:hypothetical protein
MNRFTAACVAFSVQGTAIRIHIEEANNGVDLEIAGDGVTVDGFPGFVDPTSLKGTFTDIAPEASTDASSYDEYIHLYND